MYNTIIVFRHFKFRQLSVSWHFHEVSTLARRYWFHYFYFLFFMHLIAESSSQQSKF